MKPLLAIRAIAIATCFNLLGVSLGQPVQAQPPTSIYETTVSIPGTPSPLDVNKLAQSLDRQDISGAVRLVELGWKAQFENYYQGRFTIQFLSLNQIQNTLERVSRLTGKKTALIYAIPTPNQLELILVPPTGKPIHQRVTVANRATLLKTAQTFRMQVSDRFSRRADYQTTGQQLHQWLISPLEPGLKAAQIDTLIFCLGNGLRSLPLAALHDGNQFLVEKYSLGIIPAFNLLDRNPAAIQGAQVLAMGASEFQSEPPLPAVPTELRAIADTLWEGDFLLNQQFTIENLRAKRAQTPYGIVHLATHAEFTPGAANQSFIQFWNQKLRPTQFRELGLRAPVVQLLVLSACETALGDPQAELGFAGLAVQSGSKAALASLWAVSDAGTLTLMTEFYRQLKTAPTKTEALRRSQIALLKRQANLRENLALRSSRATPLPSEIATFAQANLSHPYYWSAFTMIGNPW